MSSLTQKLSRLVFAESFRAITLSLFLVVFGIFLINTRTNTVAAADEQVSFTATGTGVITGVTHLPGGLTQSNVNTSGSATHLGNFTGPLTRIQDNQGTFGSTAVIVGGQREGQHIFSVSGRYEHTKDKCVLTSTGTYTVTGGAGRVR